jgi:hypothetical protein
MRVTYIDEHLAFGGGTPAGATIPSFSSSIVNVPRNALGDADVILEFLGDFESPPDALKIRSEGFETALFESTKEYIADTKSFTIPHAIWAGIVADGVVNIEYVLGPDTQEGTSIHGIEEYLRLIFSWDIFSNSTPYFTGAKQLHVEENLALVGSVAAVDPDGDRLSYTVTGGADGSLFTVDSQTGALSFRVAPDFEAPMSASGTNTYEVRINASDGVDSTSRLFTIEVIDVPGDEPAATVEGSAGNDIFLAKFENAIFDGGEGRDTVVYDGKRGDFVVTRYGDGSVTVFDGTYIQALSSIERLQFDDGTLAFDFDGTAGQAYRLYQAAFDRAPDEAGLAYWIDYLDDGTIDLDMTADRFVDSAEFIRLYGDTDSVSNGAYIELLYQNALGRGSDVDGFAFWLERLDAGTIDRGDALAFFSESPENIDQVASTVADGMWYV